MISSRRHSTDGSFGNDAIINDTFAINGYCTVGGFDSNRKQIDKHEAIEEENCYFRKELQKHKARIKELEIQERKTSENIDSLEHELELKNGEISRLKKTLIQKPVSDNRDLEESRLMINRLEDEIKKLKADLTC